MTRRLVRATEDGWGPMSDAISIRQDESPQRGYDRVLGFVREQLLAGTLKAGDRLLPERELAAKLGVSRR